MKLDSLKLYQSPGSPNSRRVRIFLAEKNLSVPIVDIDLGNGEQHSEAYRAINPRRVVPTLLLEDGTAIGEVPAICRYFELLYPQSALFGESAKEQAIVTMWERRVELEGFASVMEAIRNTVPGLKGRAIAGPHNYEQIPALVERSRQRVVNFLSDLDERLIQSPFIAGDRYTIADITALTSIDFASKALSIAITEEHAAIRRWYDSVSARPSAMA